MLDLANQTLGWVLSHPWIVAGSFVLCLSLLTGSILLNPGGTQLREKLPRRR